jgi:hypothetical protein
MYGAAWSGLQSDQAPWRPSSQEACLYKLVKINELANLTLDFRSVPTCIVCEPIVDNTFHDVPRPNLFSGIFVSPEISNSDKGHFLMY